MMGARRSGRARPAGRPQFWRVLRECVFILKQFCMRRGCQPLRLDLNRRLLGGASRPGLAGAEAPGQQQQHQQRGRQAQEPRVHHESSGAGRRRSSLAGSAAASEDEEDVRTEFSSEWRSSVGNLSDFLPQGTFVTAWKVL